MKIDVSEIQSAADRLFDALAQVPNSGDESCSDCGSDVVARTTQLFVEEFAQAVRTEQERARSTAEAMHECAHDFNQVETAHVQEIRGFLGMMS